ncbi:MAG TPA: response regulator transcription factor [Nitrospirota bacterium]|nr:response regulator transcription factor [Nitrospirota bacterium]
MHCLIIENEADTERFIRTGLREVGYIVTSCRESAEGLHYATSRQWDIIILDRMLPGNVDGMFIVKTLRALGKTTPVLILCSLTSWDERVRSLREGGNDYLTKPFPFSELLARVDGLTRRSKLLEDVGELRVADLKLDLRTRRVERKGKPIFLQPREFRLLEYLVMHEDQIVTRTMLLESVWDYHFIDRPNVIDVQISRLRSKIDKGFSPPLVHTIRGAGYMVSEDC